MRTRRTAWLVIAAVLAATWVPHVALAAPSASELAAQVNALDRKLETVGRDYERAHWRLDETEVRLEKVDRRAKVASKKLATAEAALANRADYLYRSGNSDYLSVLLGAEDLDDLIARLEYLRRASTVEAETIGKVKTLRTQLAADRRTLVKERKARAANAAALKRRANEAETRLDAAKAEYAKLVAARNAAAAWERATTGTSSWRAPRGPNGMVFPVAGACYFSDTWGASRSGGRRRHQGTDIMAARGTPVVAILSGSVRASNGGLGGLCLWLNAGNGWQFYYAHLNGLAVRSGHVQAGQVIGYVGSTGNAAGGAPHLHFQIHPGGGGPVNPYPYLRQMR